MGSGEPWAGRHKCSVLHQNCSFLFLFLFFYLSWLMLKIVIDRWPPIIWLIIGLSIYNVLSKLLKFFSLISFILLLQGNKLWRKFDFVKKGVLLIPCHESSLVQVLFFLFPIFRANLMKKTSFIKISKSIIVKECLNHNFIHKH